MLTVPVLLMAMVPALQVRGWQWLSLALTIPVVTWGAWPFHRAAWTNLRHGAATMDTLISLGVLAAFGWSLWALLFGGAGELGMKMPFSLTSPSGGASDHLYLEVASTVTVLLLTGRYLESRATRRAGRRAPRPAWRSGPRTSPCWARTARSGASRSPSWPWGTASSSARARRWPPTASSRTAPRRSTNPC